MYFSMNCCMCLKCFTHVSPSHDRPLETLSTEVGWLCCSTNCPQWPHCSWRRDEMPWFHDFWTRKPPELRKKNSFFFFFLWAFGKVWETFSLFHIFHVLSYKSADGWPERQMLQVALGHVKVQEFWTYNWGFPLDEHCLEKNTSADLKLTLIFCIIIWGL